VEAHVPELGALLHACVLAGASVNFVLPFTREEADAFWREKVIEPARRRGRILLVARSGERIVGTVMLDVETPPNQPHRAEVTKLLVHPGARRRGIGRALMAALEETASDLGRSLLTLDTRTGDAAEPLYASLGYVTVGTIPRYCRATESERLDATTIMYKHLPT
jgi:hypothetical protein